MNLKRTILTAMVFVLTISVMQAQMKKIEFTEYKLKNGLHVILHQDNSTPVVNVSIMYHVGSKNEKTDRTGFAHFFEHLMFEGTANIPRFEYSKYVEKAGGTLNANTNVDRTYYFEHLPSNQLELGLWLESERMLHAKVDSVGIRTQKNVVIEEKKQRYENAPYGSFMIEIMKRAYKVHPYRWTTIGDAEHIRAAKDQDFVDFYKTFYVPNNACLVIAGDIDIKATKALVEKYFADIPKGKNEIPRPKSDIEPALTKEIRDTIYDNIQLPAIFQGYRIPSVVEKDYYAIDMLSALLSRGQSSRMYKSIVDQQQKALQVQLFSMQMEHPGIMIILAIPNMGVNLKDLEEAMQKEIEKVQNELISDNEMQKLKNQFESNFIMSSSSISSRANNFANFYTYKKNTGLINTNLDNYLKVTKEDIQRVAKQYFSKNNRVVLYYLPKSQKK